MRKRIPILTALFLCSFASALAQDLATLTITVADPSAALVPKAKIVIVDLTRGTIRQGETGLSGFFSIDSLQAGDFSVEVEKPGFKKYRLERLTLALRDRQTLRVDLQVGAAAGASVSVSTDAVSNDATQGITLEQTYIENLPVNGRNAESLILLAPGITAATGSIGGAGGGFNTNGLRSNTNYFTLDGVSVNQSVGGGGRGGRGAGPGDGGPPIGGGTSSTELISIDAMQEMRVQTSSFAPEFGRSPGAQVVISSRNGANSFHGSVYYYLRNDRFDANDWFANAGGYGRGKERQNRPGGTFGGPLQKDKTFFFVTYEHLELISPYSVIASVPSLATRAAAPVALRPFLNAFPIANGSLLSNGAAQYRAVVSNPSSSDSASLRLDRVINAANNFFARYSYTPADTQQRGSDIVTPNVLSINTSRSQVATGGLTTTLRNGGINDLRVNYSKFTVQGASVMDNFGGAVPLNDALVFPKSVTSATGSFSLNILGLAGYTYAGRSANTQQQINVVDSLTRTVGAHLLKAGGDYRRILSTEERKTYSESAAFNGLVPIDSNGYTITDSLLSGVALNARVTSAVPSVYPTYTNVSAYAQDTWRAGQWTTVTYGARWDLNPAPSARIGQQPFALASSNLAGVTQNEPLYKTQYLNVAPRFGIAYSMDERQGREMTIRGGMGLFYDLGYGVTSGAFGGAPYANIRTLSSVKFPLSTFNVAPPGLPATRPYGQILTADSTLKSPRVIEWNFTWERYFGVGQVLSIGYVGTSGRNLSRTETRPTFSSAYDILTLSTNGATSDYHGLQVQFRKRLSNSLQTQVSYTYAHSLDSASNDGGGAGGFASIFGTGERGSSDFDIRHNLSLSGSYRLPAQEKGWLASPIRDWFLDFVYSARTGLPFGIQGVSSSTSGTNTSTNAPTGLFAQVRPDYDGLPVYISDPNAPGGRKLNPQAFTTPTGYNQGNLARNSLRGFGFNQLDLSLRKTISISERLKLHLAAQGFNMLNHPNFANVSPFEGGNLASPAFGVVTRMVSQSFGSGVNSLYRSGGPRSMELSVRIQF